MVKILAIGDFHGKFPGKLKKIAKSKEIDLIIVLGDYAGIDGWRPYINYCFKCIIKDKKPEKTLKEFLGEKKFNKLLADDDKAGRFVLRELNKLNKNVLFLFGNGDDRFHNYPFDDFFKATESNLKFIRKLKRIKNITYGKKKIKNTWFIGFGGFMDAMANYEKNPRKEEYKEKLKDVLIRNKKAGKRFLKIIKNTNGNRVFVLHYPLKGLFDKIKEKGNPFNGGSSGAEFFREATLKYKPKLVLCGHMHEYQGKKKLGKSLVVNPGYAHNGKAAIIDWPSLKVKFVR